MIKDRATLEAIETICNRLSERTATLFLGAGINGGVKDDAGEHFPLGQSLSRRLARDLLDPPDLEASLEESAEMARYRWGEGTVNKYLYEEFLSYRPATAHLALVQLPWDVIFYYKLHGSVDAANTVEGRLILTREDYRHYELLRKPLFKRLERDLLSRTFVFVGYSLRDSNFKDILQDCRDELGSKTLPASYATFPTWRRRSGLRSTTSSY
jgi:hypothetical protein